VSITESRKSRAGTAPIVSKIRRTQRRAVEASPHGHPFRVNTANLPRRRYLHLATGAAALPAVSRMAKAQIVVDQLGNGLSSSPSNTAAPFDRMRFPTVTIRDDVAAQHRLLTEELGVRRLALVVGWSMGAPQAYQWVVSHPDMVDRIAPFCGTARTSPHNAVFLEGVRAALTADAAWLDGKYKAPPSRGLLIGP
jgi:pimeloyl-ACP methyl ester carboxylesterase